MKKLLLLILFPVIIFAQPEFSSISSKAGAFSRLGFGARGMGMGNSMSSVNTGNIASYYNPALTVFQEDNLLQTSYSILSLDRSLNFLSFTKRFDFYSSKDTAADRKPRSSAGFSIGVINSGVSKIDGRSSSGDKTGELSTSENQFFLAFANKFSDKLALGIAVKLYYYRLYDKINSTGVGLDLGVLYKINESFNLSIAFVDINSKYKWDTNPIYGQDGATTENKFPLLKKVGLSYFNKSINMLVSAELESSNAESNILRAGVEYNIIDRLFLRGGIDGWNLSNADYPVHPSAGFSYSKDFDGIIVGVDYAFVVEPYSTADRHIVGVNVKF